MAGSVTPAFSHARACAELRNTESLHTPYTRDMFGPEKPETKIVRRMIRARELRNMTSRDVAERVNASPLYGTYTHGSHRNLERTDFESGTAPRTALNVMLVTAVADALGMPVSDLASAEELSALRDKPYRKAQWPISLQNQDRSNSPKGTSVPGPSTTAKRLTAYMAQGHYSTRDFAELMTKYGYRMSTARLRDALSGENPQLTQRVITYEFVDGAARVFRGPRNSTQFESEWLIRCRPDHCPHCHPILIEVG